MQSDPNTERNAETRVQKWKRILILAWPLIVANSFWNIQLTIDRVLLGQYSTDALGAAMAVMGVFWTPMALVQQTAAYSMTFVAQYYGAKQLDKIGPAMWHAVYLSVAGGLLFLFFIPFAPFLFRIINHSATLQPLEVEYFQSLCYSALPTAVVAAASGFFTGLGQSQKVMWINGVGVVANVILDYAFIFGHFGVPAMGVAGAGYATSLANFIAAVYALYAVFKYDKKDEFGLRKGFALSADLVKRYIKYGLPSGMQWALEGLAFTVFLIFVGHMKNGDAALASSSIVVTIMMLAVLPAMGVAQASSVLVGQHLGEKNPAKAEADVWSSLQVAAMYIAAMAVTFVVIPEFYLSWFHNEENQQMWAEVSVISKNLLLFIAFFTTFDSMNLVFSFSLKGAGDTRFVTLVALLMPWPFMVLPTYLMTHWHNAIYYAWGAAAVFIVLQALVFWRRFVGGKWQKMSVIN